LTESRRLRTLSHSVGANLVPAVKVFVALDNAVGAYTCGTRDLLFRALCNLVSGNATCKLELWVNKVEHTREQFRLFGAKVAPVTQWLRAMCSISFAKPNTTGLI
jgi:hypothetical protein